MASESPDKNQRQMEIWKSFDFSPFLRPERLYFLFDQRDDVVLAASTKYDGIRFVPEAMPNTRVSAMRTAVTPKEIDQNFYQFFAKGRELIQLNPNQVTDAVRSNRTRAQFIVMAFDNLMYWLERARHTFMPAHALDPLVLSQIELELAMGKGTPDPMGYCGAYAASHGISEQEALVELELMVSSMKQNLMKSTELFWRFKKRIVDNPPQSVDDLKNLRDQMMAEFILTHRL